MASDHVRVDNLFYEQSWKDDAVVLKLGQIAADDDFMLSSYNGLFVNSALGAMPSQVSHSLASPLGFSPPFPSLPLAAPGLFIAVRPEEYLYWFGPIPARPDNTAGLAVSYTRFGQSFHESTGPDGVAAEETTLELTYKARVKTGVLAPSRRPVPLQSRCLSRNRHPSNRNGPRPSRQTLYLSQLLTRCVPDVTKKSGAAGGAGATPIPKPNRPTIAGSACQLH
jgi:hypothetical protein